MKRKQVGVIGGGQLAWMMGEAAQNLDIELIVQTPNQDDPAVSRAADVIFAPINDAMATAKLAALCDVITFENEFIDLEALKALAEQGVDFRPSLEALSPLLDKYEQRLYLQQIGLPVPQFTGLSSETARQLPSEFPVVLKSRRHGYDGQGTFILKERQDWENIWQSLQPGEMLLEEFVPFAKELAVIAARNHAGAIVVYPVVETYQEDRVCRRVIAPADITVKVKQKVEAIAKTLLTQLQFVGVVGIELFLTKDRQVLVNEIAPRTHNSGHYTLDGCNISQFEMQLRAVSDLPLIAPTLKSAGTVMVNLLGYEYACDDYPSKRTQLSSLKRAYVHWYGKMESRPGRKLGHVNVLLTEEELQQAGQIADKIESIWYG